MPGFSLTSKNLREAAEIVQGMRSAAASDRFRNMLAHAVKPVEEGVKANIHSLTGRTVRGVVSGPGKGVMPSAFVAVDPTIASRPSKKAGRDYPYAYPVEAGHGKVPPHPFFRQAVEMNRAAVRARVEQGAADIIIPPSAKTGSEFL
jgi:hypothetical protein